MTPSFSFNRTNGSPISPTSGQSLSTTFEYTGGVLSAEDAVRDERAKLLRSIRIMKQADVLADSVAGQYGPARIGGEDVVGFRKEPGVAPDAQTDTYAAVTFFVDNWRWAGVPFYIRTGKRLPKRVTEIAIQFNAAPHAVFGDNGDGTTPNLLILRIQPEEGISLRFLSKRPGAGMNLRPVSMDFNYGSSFGERSPTAYETLLLDAGMSPQNTSEVQDFASTVGHKSGGSSKQPQIHSEIVIDKIAVCIPAPKEFQGYFLSSVIEMQEKKDWPFKQFFAIRDGRMDLGARRAETTAPLKARYLKKGC
jgi:hypothetical protein